MNDQMRHHDDLQRDLAAYALGSLGPAEREELELHLGDCAECRELLAGYEQVVDLYPLSLAPQQPPEGALGRLLARAREKSAPQPVATPPNLRYLWAGFAAMAALLLVMLGWNLWLQFGADENGLVDTERIAIIVPMAGAGDAEKATAHLVMDADWEECALVASALPALSADRDYQLWFIREDGTRVSGAVFHPDDDGRISVDVEVPDNWRNLERIGVTEEPAGGSPGPTGQNVLMGEFRRASTS